MAFTDIFKKKTRYPVYKLTTLGKTKKEQANVPNMRYVIMDKIEEKEPCSIREIAEETHLSPKKIEMVIKSLVNDGWITRAGVENE